jgi:AraC family ethanolamine operon transcriptional activator
MTIEIRDLQFDEFEEFGDAFVDAGWKNDYLQLEKGHFRGRMLFSESGSTQISRCVWEKRLRHRGLQPKGTIVLGVTLSQQGGTGTYLGAPIELDTVIVQRGEARLEIFSAPTWDATSLVIPESEFTDQIAALTQRAPENIMKHRGLAKVSGPQSARLRQACHGYFSVASTLQRSPDLGSPPLEAMAADLVSLVIRVVVDSQFEPGPPPNLSRRLEIIRKTEEFAESFPNRPLRVPDVCRHVGTSERSLRYAFEDLAGISPAAYLKFQRLSRVHTALLVADPGETLVKTSAYEHRFWHLGQFSRDYRLAFGERPSETLARSARHGASPSVDSTLQIRT